MNVGNNAYYTKRYLDASHNKNRFLSFYDDEEELQIEPLPRTATPEIEDIDNIPVIEIRHNSPRFTRSDREPPRVPREVAAVRAPQEYGPELGAEITPAELNYLKYGSPQKLYYSHYQEPYGQRNYNYRVPSRRTYYDRPMYEAKDPYIYERATPQMPKAKEEEQYYIERQRRQEQLPIDLKQFTHPSFREVFEDEKEPQNDVKYNPMETVFDKPRPETPPPGIVQKAFKAVVPSKGSYTEYDYYKHEDKEYREKFEKAVKLQEEQARAKMEAARRKKEARQRYGRKVMAKLRGQSPEKREKPRKIEHLADGDYVKMRVLSGELSKSSESKKSAEEEAQAEEFAKIEDAVEKKLEQLSDSKGKSGGKKDDEKDTKQQWHPAWAYVLSWLVYETGTGATLEADAKKQKEKEGALVKMKRDAKRIVTPPKDVKYAKNHPGAAVTTKRKYTNAKNITKRRWNSTKNTFGMLTSPALNLFSKELDQTWWVKVDDASPKDNVSMKMSKYDSDRSAIVDENNRAIEIEVDADDPVEEMLYFDEKTGQLCREPPNRSVTFTERLQGLLGAGAGTQEIFLNLANAIKSIKIMSIIFAPIDAVASQFPHLQTLVIVVELGIFLWILYELSRLVDALCMVVKTFCSPFIAIGRIMSSVSKK